MDSDLRSASATASATVCNLGSAVRPHQQYLPPCEFAVHLRSTVFIGPTSPQLYNVVTQKLKKYFMGENENSNFELRMIVFKIFSYKKLPIIKHPRPFASTTFRLRKIRSPSTHPKYSADPDPPADASAIHTSLIYITSRSVDSVLYPADGTKSYPNRPITSR